MMARDLAVDLRRHWCPRSEPYTGCDSLLTALDNGWTLDPVVFIEEHGIYPRRIIIYRFRLRRAQQAVTMRVIHNPHVPRVIEHYEVEVMHSRARRRVPSSDMLASTSR